MSKHKGRFVLRKPVLRIIRLLSKLQQSGFGNLIAYRPVYEKSKLITIFTFLLNIFHIQTWKISINIVHYINQRSCNDFCFPTHLTNKEIMFLLFIIDDIQ
jgi:hypothetical protein